MNHILPGRIQNRPTDQMGALLFVLRLTSITISIAATTKLLAFLGPATQPEIQRVSSEPCFVGRETSHP